MEPSMATTSSDFLGGGDKIPRTFFNHVFSTTDESKAEIINVMQYAFLGLIPIVLLNKGIQRFIPEAKTEKSSIELILEIGLQMAVLFIGILLIHRVITYFPTYSGYPYETLVFTNVILAFLVIVLSIQTRMGLKVNILLDRLETYWNGDDYEDEEESTAPVRRRQRPAPQHIPGQADSLDDSSLQNGIFPPAPTASKQSRGSPDVRGPPGNGGSSSDPVAANTVLGCSFGSTMKVM